MSLVDDALEQLEQGHAGPALELLALAHGSAPRTCAALGEIAALFRRAGDVERAETTFREAIEAPPDNSLYHVFVGLAGVLRDRAMHLDACRLFRQARRVASTSDEASAAARAAIDLAITALDYPAAIEDLLFLQGQSGGHDKDSQAARHGPYAMEFHKWYYDSRVWQRTTYRGVACCKLPSDMWNYQEILGQLKAALVIEFGTFAGGATLFFADTLEKISPRFRVFSADINHNWVPPKVRRHPHIELATCSSTDPRVHARIAELRSEYPGPAFAIVDSDHSKAHVLAELEQLRDLLVTGDYLIVEDTNLNGHPVLPDFGPGPHEAAMEYQHRHPDDYLRDDRRALKFGFSFAPDGFLIRR